MQRVENTPVLRNFKEHKGMKLLSALTMAIPMFLGSVEKAHAARTVDSVPGQVTVSRRQMGKHYVSFVTASGHVDPGTHEYFWSSEGDIMYCLEPEKDTPSGSHNVVRQDNGAVRAVLRVGYQVGGENLFGTANSAEAMYATQLAVWTAAGAIKSINWAPGAGDASQAETNRIHSAYNQIMSQARQSEYQNDGATSLKIENVGNIQEDKDNNVWHQTMKVDATQNAQPFNEKIKLTLDAPEGTTITQDGKPVTDGMVDANKNFVVTVRNQDHPGAVTVNATGDAVSYVAATVQGSASQQSSTTLLAVRKAPATAQGSFRYVSRPGESSGQKISDENEVMGDVKFGIYKDNNGKPGDLVETVTTDKNGMFSVKDLKYGKYWLVELQTNKDMILDSTPHGFDVEWNKTQYDAGRILNNHVIPEVGTTATNKEDGSKIMQLIKGPVTINDKVHYEHVIPSKEYTIKGTLMDKATGKPLLVNGKEVTATKNFTPTNSVGDIDIPFTLQAGDLAGHDVVVFEDLIRTSKPDHYTTKHENINDQGQTVHFTKPEIHTTAVNNETNGKKIQPTDREDLKDTVAYKDLVPGKNYVMKGTLMDKATGKPVTVNGKSVTDETKFKPTASTGTVDVHFVFDARKLRNHDLVAFETCYYNGYELVDHKDIKDQGQTVHVTNPQLHTTLSDNAQKLVAPKEDNTVEDVVKYTDLLPGVKYTVRGKLMDQVTGLPVMRKGVPVQATATFTPNQPNGTVTLTFHFDGTQYVGHALVAFEDLYDNGRLVTAHENINDIAQTVLVDHKKPSVPCTPTTPGQPTNTPTSSTPLPSSTPGSSTPAAVLPQTANGKTNLWAEVIAMAAMVTTVGTAVRYVRRHQANL